MLSLCQLRLCLNTAKVLELRLGGLLVDHADYARKNFAVSSEVLTQPQAWLSGTHVNTSEQ